MRADGRMFGRLRQRILDIIEAIEGHNTGNAALALDQLPREAADHDALVGQFIDLAAEALGMDRFIRLAEQLMA